MNIAKSIIALLMAVLILFLQSCATILGGSRDTTHVRNGEPPNAKVYYNGNYVGTAPTNVRVNKQCKKAQCHIEIKAEGYETEKVVITRKISVGYLILDICFGLFPLAVDFATGNIYKPRPNTLNYSLSPVEGYNPAERYDFKVGDKVYFSEGKYEHQEGEIIAVYPNRALVKFKRSPTTGEKLKGVKDDVEDKIEVDFVNIAKR